MTRREEIEFNKKADKMLRGHRPVPNGRDFRYWCNDRNNGPGSPEALRQYRKSYDLIKWDAPPPGKGLC